MCHARKAMDLSEGEAIAPLNSKKSGILWKFYLILLYFGKLSHFAPSECFLILVEFSESSLMAEYFELI